MAPAIALQLGNDVLQQPKIVSPELKTQGPYMRTGCNCALQAMPLSTTLTQTKKRATENEGARRLLQSQIAEHSRNPLNPCKPLSNPNNCSCTNRVSIRKPM